MCVYIYIVEYLVFEKKWMKGKRYIIFSVIVPGGWLEIFELLYFFVKRLRHNDSSNYLKLHGKVTFAGAQNEKRNFNKDLNRGRM